MSENKAPGTITQRVAGRVLVGQRNWLSEIGLTRSKRSR